MKARVVALLALVVASVASGQDTVQGKSRIPRDVFGGLITAPNDMDKWHTGTVKALTDNAVTVEGMDFKPGALKGKVICPNWDRPVSGNRYLHRYYRITGNTADTITTDPADGKLTESAKAGDKYLMAGFFRLQLINKRWVMIDPLDHPAFPMGPATLNTTGSGYLGGDLFAKKFGSGNEGEQKWWDTQYERIISIGWNASMEYGFANFPNDYGYRKPQIPYYRMVRAAELEALKPKAKGGWLDSPIKNILDGIHGRVFMDVFDPSFAKAYGKGLSRAWGPSQFARNDPWVIGFVTEESDNLYGLLRPNFSLGWCAAACRPQQEKSSRGVEYSDSKVYTKYALAEFLKGKYGDIAKLNAAWGSKYTTFDSAGGWGKGTGLLDEDGKLGQAWLGNPIKGYDPHKWEGANANCRKDLLAFQVKMVERFYKSEYEGLKAQCPDHLVVGYANNTTLPEEYWAESKYVDMTESVPPDVVMQMKDIGTNMIKPYLLQAYICADTDSALAPLYKAGKGNYQYPGSEFKNQAARGQEYYDRLIKGFDRASASGIRGAVGMQWWAWGDDSNEKRNWGIVSFKDNLYDGKQATKLGADGQAGTWDDEEADYGDCVTKVRQANFEMIGKLCDELKSGKASATTQGGAGGYNAVPDNPDWFKK